MTTYFLGVEEVRAFLLDFLERLQQAESFPTVWCPVTESGDSIVVDVALDLVAGHHPDWLPRITLLPIEVSDGSNKIAFLGGDPSRDLPQRSVLVLDGAIHSGRMMGRCVDAILGHAPASVLSYGLVVKRCSCFIPSLWSLMIDEEDRAFFLLDKIPNQRLDAGACRPQPPVQIRLLNESHIGRPLIRSGLESIDRMKWSDRHFQMCASHGQTRTYVLEKSTEVAGFVTLHTTEAGDLVIEEIAVDENLQGCGYGGVLLRFADTLARQSDCRMVRLNAIAKKVEWYMSFDYQPEPGAAALAIDEEKYVPMRRTVLYHQPHWR